MCYAVYKDTNPKKSLLVQYAEYVTDGDIDITCDEFIAHQYSIEICVTNSASCSCVVL